MAVKIKLGEVTVENIKKGRNQYSVANVNYSYNGETRSKKILSFANPEVFKLIQEFPTGSELEVEITKNDQGYDQWAKVVKSGDVKPAATSGRVTGSNYETPDERAKRQVLIVRQSSLAQAITYHGSASTGATKEEILDTAQEFADWVFDTDPAPTLETMMDDVPV